MAKQQNHLLCHPRTHTSDTRSFMPQGRESEGQSVFVDAACWMVDYQGGEADPQQQESSAFRAIIIRLLPRLR